MSAEPRAAHGVEALDDPGRSRLRLRVQPGASRAGLLGPHDGALRVAVHAPPAEGRANKEVVRVVARALGVSRASVRLVAGERSRSKTLEVDLGPDELVTRLLAALA